MDKKEFTQQVAELLGEYLPGEIRKNSEIQVCTREKNNDTLLHGVMVKRNDKRTAPIIYVDEIYENYRKGMPLEELVKGISETVEKEWEHIPEITEEDLKYENIKEKVIFRVIHAKMNQSRLKELKGIPIGNGIAMTFHIEIGEGGSIPITRGLAEAQEYRMERVCNDAIKNTQRLYPACLERMEDALFKAATAREAGRNLLEEGKPVGDGMYVITNLQGQFGAAALFYPEVKEVIGRLLGDNYYAIPSSVHEFIILPEKMGFDGISLQNMLRDINKSVVSWEDVLGDQVFFYDREKEMLKIMDQERSR